MNSKAKTCGKPMSEFKVSQVEKYRYAMKLLKELNCPKPIMDALEVWGIFVHDDEIKLHNWEALSEGGIVEGEARELPPETMR